MSKRTNKFKIALGVAAVATSLLIAMVPACSKKEEETKEEENKTTVDTQEIKNGNFEFYKDNDGLYPICPADNWSVGTKGSSSTSMSGIIDTAKDNWERITASGFGKVLDDNNDLKSDDENKVDYNGATSDDLLYANPHVALGSSPSESDLTVIKNPLTHKYAYDADGNMTTTTYKDEDGKEYTDEEKTKPLETSVLMLHNFRQSYYTGTETYGTSSTTITLEASTACEISLWVKTCDLYFDGANASRTKVESERGAYIRVNTQVGGNSVDEFIIKNINTEKLIEDAGGTNENNGWLKYTVYVEASSFANTTVNLTLGLGQDDIYTVEGYAFFDDVEFKKYTNKAELQAAVEGFDTLTSQTTYYPLASEKTSAFRVDRETIKTNGAGGQIVNHIDPHYSANKHFFINFAKTTEGTPISIGAANMKAGYTVEETSTGKYVCSQAPITTVPAEQLLPDNFNAEHIIPTSLKNKINVSSDIIKTFTGINSAEWTCGLGSEYDTVINNALNTVYTLPGSNGNAMLILSARGATYEAQITDASFTLADGENALITFWVKTSDMNGNTAATVTVVDVNDKKNTSNFSVDSTTVSAVDIGENKDVYNGWVRCFVRVSNTSEEEGAKSFKINVNFGSKSVKGSTIANYNSGWLAVANMSIMKNLDKDVYGYSSGVSNCATLEFGKEETNSSFNFDTELGDKNVIETGLAIPNSYNGVNGASTHVSPTYGAITDDDAANADAYAGLINKNYFANYSGSNWYNVLSVLTGETDSAKLWNKIAGEYTVQPLIIVNTIKEGESAFRNYGYIAKTSKSVTTDGYTAISVKVKASAGAIANIYLVETGKEADGVACYDLPKYTFWYDDDGNILKDEPAENQTKAQKKANIAYTLRADGLYEKDGQLYANIYNLSRDYDINHLENIGVYTVYRNGQAVNIDKIEKGVDYYANAEGTNYAPHYLIAGGVSNNKVYAYNSGMGNDATYYYMENGVKNENKLVHGVDVTVAKPRYTEADTVPYQFTIDTTTADGAKYIDKWVTVTFNIHAGKQAKNFRLELWSGTRDNKVTASTTNSYILFDLSNATLDSSSFGDRLNAYTEEIIADYRDILDRSGTVLEDNDSTIADLEKLAGEDKHSGIYNYVASYYTFSLYDSASFIPFNAETAEDPKAGYSYSYSDYSESLAFLKVEDADNFMMSSFIDYSVLDKDIEIIGAPTVADHDHDEETTTNKDSTNVWLLAASIILVVAIIITAIAIFLRSFIKKHKGNRKTAKNSYNHNKNKRYVKKYEKANGEAPEIKEGEFDENLMTDKAEEAEVEVVPEVEEVEEVAEEPAAEEPAETPTEETAAEPEGEKPAEGEAGKEGE